MPPLVVGDRCNDFKKYITPPANYSPDLQLQFHSLCIIHSLWFPETNFHRQKLVCLRSTICRLHTETLWPRYSNDFYLVLIIVYIIGLTSEMLLKADCYTDTHIIACSIKLVSIDVFTKHTHTHTHMSIVMTKRYAQQNYASICEASTEPCWQHRTYGLYHYCRHRLIRGQGLPHSVICNLGKAQIQVKCDRLNC